MELSLLQENLNLALQNVSRFVSSKNQLPILNNILFTTDNGRLKLSATNLEIGINYWLGAKIDTEGSFVIPAKEIAEYISYLSTGKIDLSLNPQSLLEVSNLKTQSTFSTLSATDFPVLPSLDQKSSLEIDFNLFSQAISQVAFAAATDDSRPILTGILCHFSSNSFSLVSTDGFRLSQKTIQLTEKISLPDNKELTFLIPSRSLQEVSKLAKNIKKIRFGASSDSHQLVFVLEDIELISRLIEGDFPDYKRIIPDAFSTKIFINKGEFDQAIKIASVFARESANVVKFSLKKDSLEISANAPQIGQNKVTIDARIEGEPLDIAFNYKFISDFLTSIKGEEVVIELNEALSPGLFHNLQENNYTHIIMPVRIQD